MWFLRRSVINLLFVFICGLFASGQKVYFDEQLINWEQNQPPSPEQLSHSIYLVGDIKYPSTNGDVLSLLEQNIQHKKDASVIFLGDIIYPVGLPDEENRHYEKACNDIATILNKIDDFKGNTIFMAGNHDWDRGRQEGWENVLNEESYIESVLENEAVYMPGEGCPGPEEIHLTDDIVAIVFDSQWWFHKYNKPGPGDGCDFEDEAGLFIQIEDIIRRNKGKKILFTTHHPLFSVGNHGGHFAASRLLFPMLDVNKYLYIPLPGFLYTWYRKYLGHIQDLAHPEYKIYRQTMLEIFRKYPELIFASGHEHNLQYFESENLHHIVSGGGGEGTYIAKRKKKTDFAIASSGFSVLNFYENGDVWIEYWIPEGTDGKLTFRHKLFNKPVFDREKKETYLSSIDFADSSVTVSLTDIYTRGRFSRFWMGDNYRDIWSKEVKLPVFDIGTKKGGLEILKRGGGQQTRSVRLQDKNGKQYVLRSVNKYVEKALEVELRNTIAEDVVQDGISASHPYAAITVPKLADAAGVMHTNPEIVWVPDDPRLGIYRENLANDVFLFEERPAKNRDDVASFGFSEKIISTPDVIKKTENEHDHIIDQQAVLRARLFDILINDWDRHDDQWRWAKFREDDMKIYRPVPRDRDQVYFVNEGVLMWLVRQDFVQPKFQGFEKDIKNVKGLGFNARYFDRSFLTEPDLENWLKTAESIKSGVTDSVVHAAISDLPPEIYEISGPEIEVKLKSRRDKLDLYAEEYYRYLSKNVDVVGTDDRDYFEITRLDNGNTTVRVYEMSKKKGKIKQLLYKRAFDRDVTKEIRLYGLKDKDKFVFTGSANRAIKIRLIPGKGNDSVIDHSKITGLRKNILLYDRKDKKNYFQKSKEIRRKLSKDKSVDDYDRKQFKYNKTMPLVLAGFNIDDGFFVGGGAILKRYNFRDSTRHSIGGRLAFATGAFGIDYNGLYSSFSQFFDLEVDARFSAPRNVDNFFGYGNETKKITNDRSYYRVRYEYADLDISLIRTVDDDFRYKFGAFYQYFNVDDTANRFIGDILINDLDSNAYLDHHFTGLNGLLELDTRNSEIIPQRGVFWITRARAFYGLDENAKNFLRLTSDLRFYLSFTADPRVVFAFRFGGAVNIGQHEFYHSNFLGGETNLRGFRRNRFAGKQSVYQNTEIRFKLLNLNNYIFKGQTGFYVFNDIGRVWVDGEKSQRWHDGYGVGVWLTPFEFTAITFSYNLSYDDRLFAFSFRFLF